MILLLRLLIDFGLLILIWLVQLIIYPAFKFQPADLLQQWHKLYTQRISFVVVPLMLLQLILSIFHLWKEVNLYTAGTFSIILFLWIYTFSVFVPLHSTIDQAPSKVENVRLLVVKNKFRTFGWSIVFLWSLANYCATFYF